MSILFRPSADRGFADRGWLQSRHSFSFADYLDPRHMGFRSLRVLNEDVIQPRGGFPTHGHQDMEVLTFIVSGALEHKDSTGEQSVIRRGDVQRMTAGTGIRHSESNPSDCEPVHLLQVWVRPEREELTPGYQERTFPEADRAGRLVLLASREGRDGSLWLNQDADFLSAVLKAGETATHPLRPGRGAWVQVVAGSLDLNGIPLGAGDGAAAEDEACLLLTARGDCEVLLIDLA